MQEVVDDVRRGALRDIATNVLVKGASVEGALIITGYRTSKTAKRNIRSYVGPTKTLMFPERVKHLETTRPVMKSDAHSTNQNTTHSSFLMPLDIEVYI